MEWVEAHGKTVDGAVKAALDELGLQSKEDVAIEILQEPKRAALGLFGGQDAIVKVTKVEQDKKRRRRRRGGSDKANSGSSGGNRSGGESSQGGRGGQGGRNSATSGRDKAGDSQRSGERNPRGGRNDGGSRPQSGGGSGAGDKDRKKSAGSGDSSRGRGRGGDRQRNNGRNNDRKTEAPVDVDINEQAEVGKEFLTGLLDAFGLEGTVTTRIEEEVLFIDIAGDQTEALVGPKGSIMNAVKELTRTVIQRKTHDAPRMRVDVGGYTERRRAALGIYTSKLADQLLDDGGEMALEPMNAADRKVVHDAVADIDGVQSFSEGEDPRRYVVLSLEGGVKPRKAAEAPSDSGEDEASSEEE